MPLTEGQQDAYYEQILAIVNDSHAGNQGSLDSANLTQLIPDVIAIITSIGTPALMLPAIFKLIEDLFSVTPAPTPAPTPNPALPPNSVPVV